VRRKAFIQLKHKQIKPSSQLRLPLRYHRSHCAIHVKISGPFPGHFKEPKLCFRDVFIIRLYVYNQLGRQKEQPLKTKEHIKNINASRVHNSC